MTGPLPDPALRPAPAPPASRRLVALLGLVLVALAMRSAIGIVGSVFSYVSDDLGLDVVVLSVLGAAPPLGFAFAGLVTPRLARRFGLEAGLVLGILALVLGQVVRALSGEAIVLVAGTFLGVVGIGVGNVLLPPLVRRYFPDRIGAYTSLYLVLMTFSASVPAFVGVQVAEALGWRWALGMWVVLPLLALVPWVVLGRAMRRVDAVEVLEETPPARGVGFAPTAWAITAVLTLSSVSVYAAFAFLPTMLIDVGGLDPAPAAAALGVVLILGVPEALLVPIFQRYPGTILPLIVVAGLCTVGGWAGLVVAPGAAPFLWATLIGLVPITFPLALLLVNTRSRHPRTTVSLSGFVQGIAYVSAGVFTFGLGVLHDLTGGWTASLVVLAATGLFAVPGVVILARGRYVDDELHAAID